jgi:hypothetical protein
VRRCSFWGFCGESLPSTDCPNPRRRLFITSNISSGPITTMVSVDGWKGAMSVFSEGAGLSLERAIARAGAGSLLWI